MNETLKKIIEKTRIALESDPDGPVIGKIRSGKEVDFEKIKGPKDYYDFLGISNGARCGAIDVFPFETMSGSQSLLEFIENPEDAKEQWIYIGQTLYEPLLINELDGLVYQFYEGPPLEKGECYGTFDCFLLNYVFGKKYSEVIPDADNDDWFQLLKKLQIV
ncbi:hypothetical protein FLT15_24985 [Paenibacillus thiaminolyticus]|uniref:hypothetical protein n=1 Tax=Paenibacillus thiaminolyticus TaxID=49283 RepID=UPI001165BFB8|nr:hypothetical protein [Paenibacillus thiaminolyticus]MDG0872237.1 hypothetical protein [Paenibacillus thiaminolyticus]NGP61482.1 hypothetical protein [Paenibacillus thiaminolyticus]